MQDWYFSEEDRRLVCPERAIQLTPKAASVLVCLQRNRGEVVSIDTILEEVWPDTHVMPDLVREYIHDLREALEDDARHPRYIETVRGKGFRLIGGIKIASGDDIGAFNEGHDRLVRPTVAVLKPIYTDDRGLNTIADEVVSEVINHLARFHYIGVVARQSTFASSEINDIRAFARELQAKYILDINYSRMAGKIRVRIQLVDATIRQNLWGTRIDLTEGDDAAVVEEISNTIVLALTGWHGELHRAEFKAASRKRGGELNAFEHFVLGCDLEMRLDADGLSRSLAHLEKSVRLDPTLARAWLVYALALRWAYSVIPGRDRSYLQKASQAFESAFNLAPTDPVNLALGAMNTARIGNLGGALAMLTRAEASMNGDSDAMVCVATAKSMLTDDVEGACAILDTVKHLNSAAPNWFHFSEAGIAFMSGDYARCVASSRSGPKEISSIAFRCLALAMLDHEEEALQTESSLFMAFPEFNFMRFAENLPIAFPARRLEYEKAVARLEACRKRFRQHIWKGDPPARP